MLIRPSRSTNLRMESLTGSVMVDTVNGQIRIRAWPKPRPGKKSKAQQEVNEKFAQAQRAAKYLPAAQMTWLYEQTEGTPLLPRDLFTAMMFNQFLSAELPNGKVLYPMASREQVTAALDTITQTPGAMLIRGEQHWEAGQGGSGGSVYSVLEVDAPTGTTQIICPVPSDAREMMITAKNLTISSYSQLAIQVSTGTESEFHQELGDYWLIQNDGRHVNASGFAPFNQSAYYNNSFAASISPLNGALQPMMLAPAKQATILFGAAPGRITFLRFYEQGGRPFSGTVRFVAKT